jgi:hypothetical protein
MLLSLIVVFGRSLFSCSSEQEKEKIIQVQQTVEQNLAPISQEEKITTKPEQVESANLPALLEPIEFMKDLERIDTIYRDIEEISIIDSDKREYVGVMMGMAVSTIQYQNYLQEIIPTIPTEYDENGLPIPLKFASKVFPNPIVDQTTLEIELPIKDRFQIDMYDMTGKYIQSIYSGKINRGTFRQAIDMTNLMPGNYLITILSKEYKESIQVNKL